MARITTSHPSLPPQSLDLPHPHGNSWFLTLGALGVVFGDIGTSPLYALGEIFSLAELAPTPANVIGSVSLILWVLTLVVTIKYLTFVMRADNDGEGGVFALYALLHHFKRRGVGPFLYLLLMAAGLLFGDGIITPAISVLSAVEGLKGIAPAFASSVVPVTLGILAGLFTIQKRGTAKVGSVFGPLIVLWFVVIGYLGLRQLVAAPGILAAINPLEGLQFLLRSGWHVALLVLGGVMLSVTGGEALYADMGHFGRGPIRRGWFLLVFPSLLLAYLGQGAYLLSTKAPNSENLFYSLVPHAWLLPMIVLATFATIIASQALISGAYSLAAQATALGLFPRFRVIHTHLVQEGQIYAPLINMFLFMGCSLLVFQFGSSSALASAYGLAVAGNMLATSLAMGLISTLHWKWSRARALLVFGSLAALDLLFLIANSLKFLDGGYVPVAIGLSIFLVMLTWRWGRKATFAGYLAVKTMTVRELIELKEKSTTLLDKNVILMVPRPVRSEDERTPALLQLFWNRYQILPKNLIFVQVVHRKVPYIYEDRYEVTTLQRSEQRGSMISVAISFGFMEEANVEQALSSLANHHEIRLPADKSKWLVHVGQENLIRTERMGIIARSRYKLFALLRQMSQPGYYYYGLGDEVQLSVDIIPVKIRGSTGHLFAHK